MRKATVSCLHRYKKAADNRDPTSHVWRRLGFCVPA